SFLGLANYYWKFIYHFATIAAPLTKLLCHHKEFTWNGEQQLAFDKLKRLLMTAPVLTLPNLDKPFILYFDTAGSNAISGILCQKNNEDEIHPIAYKS